MGIVASNAGGSNIPPIDAGTYPARCIQVVHVGTVETEYQGQKKKTNKIRIVWELPTEKYEFDEAKGEEPRIISNDYTLSLHEKASLKKHVEAWRGQPFTAEELEGFDVSKLAGHGCTLSIIQGESKKNGNKYAAVSSVAKEMKGVALPEQHNETVLFMYSDDKEVIKTNFLKVSKFIQDEIVTSEEWKALNIERPSDESDSSEGSTPNDEVADAVAASEEGENPEGAKVVKPPF